MKTLVVVTTYQRQSYLDELLPELMGEDRTVVVWDDGSEPRAKVPKGVQSQWVPHHGRLNYGALVGRIFRKAAATQYDRFCMIPDDVTPAVRDPFFEMEDVWREVVAHDPYAICLNTLVDKRGIIGQWGSNHPVKVTDRAWMTGWNDLCIYANLVPFTRVAAANDYKPPLNHHHGSGVGSQLTRHLRRAGNLYQVDDSIWFHRAGPSVMCPEHRREVPL